MLYQIDLSTIAPLIPNWALGCQYCYVGAGPLYPVMTFAAGDTIDFGTIKLESALNSHNGGWWHPDVEVSYVAAAPPWGFYSALDGGDVISTFQMIYTIPDGHDSIQIAWDRAGGTYIPPAVPEPATWLLMLLGFAFVVWMPRRQSMEKS